MIRWILAIAALYTWNKSQQTGQPFIDTAQAEVSSLLARINQLNPPQPVTPTGNLRVVHGILSGGAAGSGSGGSSGSPVAPKGGYTGRGFNLTL